MTTHTYTVAGMTCDHCVRSVTEEVTGIPEVEDVSIDLTTGSMTVTGDGVNDSAISEAVAEAGYSLAF